MIESGDGLLSGGINVRNATWDGSKVTASGIRNAGATWNDRGKRTPSYDSWMHDRFLRQNSKSSGIPHGNFIDAMDADFLLCHSEVFLHRG